MNRHSFIEWCFFKVPITTEYNKRSPTHRLNYGAEKISPVRRFHIKWYPTLEKSKHNETDKYLLECDKIFLNMPQLSLGAHHSECLSSVTNFFLEDKRFSRPYCKWTLVVALHYTFYQHNIHFTRAFKAVLCPRVARE